MTYYDRRKAMKKQTEPVKKDEKTSLSQVFKANPYHDGGGKFTSKDKDADGQPSGQGMPAHLAPIGNRIRAVLSIKDKAKRDAEADLVEQEIDEASRLWNMSGEAVIDSIGRYDPKLSERFFETLRSRGQAVR